MEGGKKMEEKIKRGQEHCDSERTKHLQRGGGRDQLCGVRDEKRGKIGNRQTENLEHREGK